MSLASILRRFFPRRPDPLEPNVEFIDTLRAEAAGFAADKARRDAAIDAAMTVAHRHAMADDRALRRIKDVVPHPPMTGFTPTAYTRKAKSKVTKFKVIR